MNEGVVFNMVGGSSAPKVKPESLAVTTPPRKTEYLQGDVFSQTGMVVTVTFTDGTTKDVEGYMVSPLVMEDGLEYVTITYTSGGVTVSTYQYVDVIHRLLSLSVTKRPTKTLYEIGDRVDLTGGVFTATYSDGEEINVVNAVECEPSVFTVLGDTSVEARYSERGITASANFPVTVERKTIGTIPSQSGTLTYTGSVLFPEWNGYDPNVMTLGGVVNATDAGMYTATFTPNEGCRWADGSTLSQSVNWTIGKANGSVLLSPASLTLNAEAMTGTVTVTKAGDGELTARSDNEAVAVVSLSGDKVTVTAKGDGAANVTVYAKEGKNHRAAEASCPVTVQLSAYDPVFANNTWEDIIDACQKNKVPDTWVPGDAKEMQVLGRTVSVQIIGKNHDEYTDGSGKAPITFCTKELTSQKEWTWVAVDTGEPLTPKTDSWANSLFRDAWIYNTSAFTPYDAMVKEVKKMTAVPGLLSYASKTDDKFFLLSEAEVFGKNTYSISGEGTQYAFFMANGTEGRKKKEAGTNTTREWWTRSPVVTSSEDAIVTVSSTGTVSTKNVLNSAYYPVAFCF